MIDFTEFQVLKQEQRRIGQILDNLPHRLAAITGSVAVSSGFVSYLGAYHYNFRRMMLTLHWPNCLRERGVPLVIDSIDEIKGMFIVDCVSCCGYIVSFDRTLNTSLRSRSRS